MSFLNFSSSMAAIWGGVISFFNSSFTSAFLSALAGAGFGVWGAQKLAERSTRTKELLEGLRQANAIVVLATTIANQALSIKKQYVKPLLDRYLEDRQAAMAANEKLLSGVRPAQQFIFQAELLKFNPLTLPMEALKSLTFAAQFVPGRAIAVVSMIEQSVTELARAVELRSEKIDAFYSASLPQQTFCQDYFGLQRADGKTNAMYHDTMVAISQYTNDVAFFSAELAEELMNHANRVRGKLLKLRSDVLKVSLVDFSSARASGLMPSREDYGPWLAGFRSQD